MKVELRIRAIEAITPTRWCGESELIVLALMTDNQFLDAILSALESLPGERWEEWKQIIEGDQK